MNPNTLLPSTGRGPTACQRPVAFTLLELLIVIMIIAILAAMLFPAFAKARDKARAVKCAQQLRQVATAMTLYAQDHDGVNVKYLNILSTSPRRDIHWEVMVQPYLRSTAVFLCPNARLREAKWHPRHLRFGHRYGLNLVGRDPALSSDFAGNLSLGSNVGVHESEVEDPSGTIWVIDASNNRVNHDPDEANMGQDSPALPSHNVDRVRQRHNDGANAAFVDGHAKWLKTLTPATWTRRAD